MHTRFFLLPGHGHTCGYVRYTRGIYVAYADNPQLGTQSAFGLGIGPGMGVSMCIACAEEIPTMMVSKAGGVLGVLHSIVVKIGSAERHFGNSAFKC